MIFENFVELSFSRIPPSDYLLTLKLSPGSRENYLGSFNFKFGTSKT